MQAALKSMMSPRSIAVIGASQGVDKFGGRVVHYLQKHGYSGAIYPINLKATEIRGIRAYPSVKDIGAVPDVAVMAVPAKALLEQIEHCAEIGVKSVILITGMLDEVDSTGDNLQDRVLRTAAAAGMRLLGPNCLGLVNFVDKIAMTPSLAMETPAVKAGGVGIVSQSGALMGTMIARGTDFGVGFSRCVSVGNQSDLELSDFFEYLVDDDATNAICLYVEGLKDTRRFFEIARRAHAACKPVLAVKAGRSAAGAAIGQSHTGSLAGSYDGFVAACTASGIVVAADPYVMTLAADLLVRLPRMPANPGGIAAISSSGGSTANFADQIVDRALRLPSASAETKRKLEEWMPAEDAHIPVDTGAFRGGTSKEGIVKVLEAMLADDDVAAVVYAMTTSPRMSEYAAMVPEIAARMGKPIVFSMLAGGMGAPVCKTLRDLDYPYTENLADTFSALELLTKVARAMATPLPPMQLEGTAPQPPQDLPTGQVTESEAKRLIAAFGIRPAGEIRIRHASGMAGLSGVALPAVVKGVSRNILHKSEANIVRVGLKTEDAVREAAEDIFAILAEKDPEGAEGVVIQEMVVGEVELFLGARFDPEFGPLVAVGFGGIFVEILRDVAIATAPVTPEAAKRMIMSLKLWPLLDGARGRAPADVDAAAEAVSRLSRLADQLGERLVEIDINPLIVKKRGEGAVAVDAAAVIAK
ncbi:acetate--CoA ligase family protein [Mesorhizobium sp. YR577]|uniref:acetate--CoA ligase family protein n=1 Tax=Mesorhizobium sp. YR577 TaxID=1884373 RepID=UPI0008E04795|nr:acetate--CoA ligase family protein [Mesorhizobium sp. YR577]SFU19649.1 acetyl-CoA synthetase (ADP-forming) [Mesorhizobium sp. YR577]